MITAPKGKSRNDTSSGFMRRRKKKKALGVACIFLPNLGLEVGNPEDRGRWKGAKRGKRASSLPSHFPEPPRRTEEGKEGEPRERRRREAGAREQGKQSASGKREKQPHESSEITSRTRAAAERARARARVLPADWGQTVPRLARIGPKHCLALCSGRPLIPLLPLLHRFFKNQNNTREGGKSLPNRPIHSDNKTK